MRSVSVETAAQLNNALQNNLGWANGKNFPVDHLHATVAESRWEYENIYGIYLTNEHHAWMALWMAICDRNVIRKRHIGYTRPALPDDALGSIELFTELPPQANLCQAAFLYFFEPGNLQDIDVLDISSTPKPDKVNRLLESGFERQAVERRGRKQPALVDSTGLQRVVLVDEWQVAITNRSEVIPDTELAVQQSAIAELAGRIALSGSEIGEDYIRTINP